MSLKAHLSEMNWKMTNLVFFVLYIFEMWSHLFLQNIIALQWTMLICFWPMKIWKNDHNLKIQKLN
jgi:hypothetical protein